MTIDVDITCLCCAGIGFWDGEVCVFCDGRGWVYEQELNDDDETGGETAGEG